MAFNTFSFLLFLPAVFLAFVFAGPRYRLSVLIVASLAFYAALRSPALVAGLALVTWVSWRAGRAISRAQSPTTRLRALWIGVGVDLGVLVAFRYLPTLLDLSSIWIAVGVSYFVFQAISYLADVYLEVLAPEPHPGYFALSLAFFPKLLQGPIERSGDLLPQLKRAWHFDYDETRAGLLIFGRGLLKKVVVADRLALYVDAVYGSHQGHTGTTLLLATYVYAGQIYFDFSGYTDMALGAARLFGIRLTQNFDSPYSATSIADFWRRWHISFSRWILDYIFKPLQMSWRDAGALGTAAALMVTFLVSGVWHGASSGFLAWGLLHGIYMAVAVYWRPLQKRLHKAIHLERSWVLKWWQRAVTFHLVCLAWIFFRSSSLSAGLDVLSRIPTLGSPALNVGNFNATELGVLLASVPFLVLLQTFGPDAGLAAQGLERWPAPGRWLVYLAVAYFCFFFHTGSAGFIYSGF